MHESYKKWLEEGKPKIFCQCPCHNEIIITISYKYRGIPKYIRGHNRNGIKHTEETKEIISNKNKGHIGYWTDKTFSEETKNKMSIKRKGNNNPMYGKHHTKESIEKISKSNLGKPGWSKGLTKEIDNRIKNISERMKKPKSEEHKNKLSQAQKERLSNPINHPMYGKSHTEESKQKMRGYRPNISGENHPCWQGGKSFEPYCSKFNEPLKWAIRERDNYQCQMPECLTTQLELLILYHQSLIVHHVHYDKPNCDPDLITLCNKHNSMVNFNRNYWEIFFMEILRKRNLLK